MVTFKLKYSKTVKTIFHPYINNAIEMSMRKKYLKSLDKYALNTYNIIKKEDNL